MESVSVGWLSILPPIIAIGLALLTKEVISSLMIGILSGTLIYTVAMGQNPVLDTLKNTFELMGNRFDLNIILFLGMVGALVALITRAGGSRAYGSAMNKRLHTPGSAMLATGGLGALIFIDDYCNCLTVGTVMKPVTDRFQISRVKLAYLIDATAAPICIIAPISSWGAAVISSMPEESTLFSSGIQAMVATVPFNLYALLSIVMIIVISLVKLDFGPMAKAEARAKKGDLGAVDTNAGNDLVISEKGRVWDLILPVVVLIVVSAFAMLENGGYFEGGMSLADAFGNCSSGPALVLGSFVALVWAFVQFVPRRLMTAREFMNGITDGVKSMVPADIILILAWTISGVCRDLLQTGEFVGEVVHTSNIPIAILPAIIFLIAAGLSFSMGTSWGTFGILIPIVCDICERVAPALIIPAMAAALAGSVFGDHCSPISDTTIMASAGAGCDHLQHVATQIPYCLVVAACCFVGYLVAGFSNGNLLLTLLVSAAMLLGTLTLLHKKYGSEN